jgi:hypothetical protein
MMDRCQVAIVGSGLAGSLLARVLAVLGYDVVLLERGTHPRFAIGESTTPLANLSLERLARRYGLTDCHYLAAHGRWLQHLPELRRGLKRGFTFYRHHPGEPFDVSRPAPERLLVAASPECSGGSWQAGGFAGALGSMVGDLIIDGTRNWARGVDFWSLALDPANGPHAGGCGTCRRVVTIDPATGAVTRNAEYYALGHASRFVRQGAVRVGSNSDTGGLKSVAFQNPDGSKVLLVLNGASAERTFAVRVGSRSFQSTLPAGAVATYRWS